MLDRNHRARLLARIQADRGLSHGARSVGRAIVCACDRYGRTRRTYDQLARLAGCDRATVGRALPKLGRYVLVHRKRVERRGRNGGTVYAHDVNLYEIPLPAAPPHKAHVATKSTVEITQAPLDPELAAVLARLGRSILRAACAPDADRSPP